MMETGRFDAVDRYDHPLQKKLREQQSEIERLQARIDALMLEFCPNEMTEEQKANWAAHQRVATDQPDAAK